MATTKRKTEKSITARQICRIHTVKYILGISDDNYRECLESRFNVVTCKNLTLLQAKSFIDELDKFALKMQGKHDQAQRDAAKQKAVEEYQKRPKRFDELDNRLGYASGAQLRKISAMWSDISFVPDHNARARALRHFIKRISGVADLRFLDSQAASKVICALTAMQKQESEPANAKTPRKTV